MTVYTVILEAIKTNIKISIFRGHRFSLFLPPACEIYFKYNWL